MTDTPKFTIKLRSDTHDEFCELKSWDGPPCRCGCKTREMAQRIAELERQLVELDQRSTKEISKWENFARDEQLRLGKVICEQIDRRSELERKIERMKPVVEAAIDSYATGDDTALWRLVREYQKEE